MAPTDGRVAKPEWRWDCRRGTNPVGPIAQPLQAFRQ